MAPWTRNFLGIPFVNMGRDRQKGVDCWGLIVLVYEEVFNTKLPLYADKAYTSSNMKQISGMIKSERRIFEIFSPTDEVSEGDVVLVQRLEDQYHVGIFVGIEVGHPYMLHTNSVRGQSFCERLTAKVFEYADFTYYRLSF